MTSTQDPTELFRAANEIALRIATLSQENDTSGMMPSEGNALAVKSEMARKRQDINLLRKQATELKQQMRAQLEQQMHSMNELMKPLEAQVKKFEEMIWTANLYLGRDEQITLISEGERVPDGTPLTIRQMVLHMDEECALHPDMNGIDFNNLELFDQWLAADPSNLNQVMPEPKGVVALKPRRKTEATGDAWYDSMAQEENARTYWLIRNGDNVHRMVTDIGVSDVLVPRVDEFTGLFRRRSWDNDLQSYVSVDLEPGSAQWLKAESAQSAKQRHFMRIALILQGLVDRTKLFHPLPEGGLSLLHPEAYDQGKAIMISDAENSLGTGRIPFNEWLGALNSRLVPGMRVTGAFNTYLYDKGCDGIRTGRPNVRPPETGQTYVIDKAVSTGVAFHYYPAYQDRRTSFTIRPGDKFVIPLDLVDAPTMREYLSARTERHEYANMFPLLQAAIQTLEDEQAQEAPLRKLIVERCAADHQLPPSEVQGHVNDLIHWWKLGQKSFTPLVSDSSPQLMNTAVTAICKELAARLCAPDNQKRDLEAVALLREASPEELLFVGRAADGSYLGYSRQTSAKPARMRLPNTGFVVQHKLSRTGKNVSSKTWEVPGTGWLKLTEVFSDPSWTTWSQARTSKDLLSDPDVDELVRLTRQDVMYFLKQMAVRGFNHPFEHMNPSNTQLMAVTYDPDEPKHLQAYVRYSAFDEQAVKENPLKAPRYLKVTMQWVKRRGTVHLVEDSIRHSKRDSLYMGAWASSASDIGHRRPWGNIDPATSEGHGLLPLHEDQEAFQEFANAYAIHVEAQTLDRNRRHAAQEFLSSIQRAYAEIKWEEIRDRYLEDFDDPEGWDDHRKTVRAPQLDLWHVAALKGKHHPLVGAAHKAADADGPLKDQTVLDVMTAAGCSATEIEEAVAAGISALRS